MRKRYLAELVGTFFVVFIPAALSATSSLPGGAAGLFTIAVASGIAVLAMVYAFGPISAAHFNPAVTLGFACAKRFPWKFVAAYWASQLTGSVLAAAVASLLFAKGAGAQFPHHPLVIQDFGTETVITFLLMLVIIAVATDRRVSSTTPAIAIGSTVVAGVLIGGPVTGGSMNPARAFGPNILAGGAGLQWLWLYWTAPFVGAVCAALCFEAIRIEHKEAKGAPNELLSALSDVQDIAG